MLCITAATLALHTPLPSKTAKNHPKTTKRNCKYKKIQNITVLRKIKTPRCSFFKNNVGLLPHVHSKQWQRYRPWFVYINQKSAYMRLKVINLCVTVYIGVRWVNLPKHYHEHRTVSFKNTFCLKYNLIVPRLRFPHVGLHGSTNFFCI